MSLILNMEADLKLAWHLVQAETNIALRREALRTYKVKLAAFLKHRLFINSMGEPEKV